MTPEIRVGQVWISKVGSRGAWIVSMVDRPFMLVQVTSVNGGYRNIFAWHDFHRLFHLPTNIVDDSPSGVDMAVCTTCGDNNPYANPAANYVCGSCRSYKAMYE